MDYLAKTLELPRWSRNEVLCSLCKCTRYGALSFLDNRLGEAGWFDSVWTASEWQAWAGKSQSPIFQLWWLSACNVFLDYMHCKYLGADQYIFGSCLYLLCFVILPDSPKQNLRTVWKWIKLYYAKNPMVCRYNSLAKLSMFVKKKDYPKLRGKAAEIKGFGAVLLHLWSAKMDKSDGQHKRIRLLLKKNVEMEQILERSPTSDGYLALPSDGATTLVETTATVVQLQKQLGEHYQAKGIRVFNVTAKSHMLMHLALYAGHVHPKLGWCFQGEDFMRVIQTLLQSCIRGNNPFQSMSKATVHYNLAKQLQYEKID